MQPQGTAAGVTESVSAAAANPANCPQLAGTSSHPSARLPSMRTALLPPAARRLALSEFNTSSTRVVPAHVAPAPHLQRLVALGALEGALGHLLVNASLLLLQLLQAALVRLRQRLLEPGVVLDGLDAGAALLQGGGRKEGMVPRDTSTLRHRTLGDTGGCHAALPPYDTNGFRA